MNVRVALAAVLALCLLAHTEPGGAQPAGKVWLIGYLDQGSRERSQRYFDAFRQGLQDLGWHEGQNVAIHARFAEGKTDQLPVLAGELVRLKVDIIVTATTPAALAAKRATTTIPIVIGFAADPVGSGIVSSLAHPGANITGWTHVGFDLRAKYLELVKEAVPHATRFGVLWNPTNQVHRPSLRVIEEAAQQLKVELFAVPVPDPREIETAFSVFVSKRADAVIVFPDGMFLAQAPLIIGLATRSRLPSIYGVTDLADAGGLMAYGVDFPSMFRRGASFVDRILKGARPGDLPVEQPTKFDLVINLKTASALGLTMPRSLLLRADRLIE